MIQRISGTLVELGDGVAAIEVGAITIEVHIPVCTSHALQNRLGQPLTLLTQLHLEGNLAIGNLSPRLVGFLTTAERDLFSELIKVKGISLRRALRAMSVAAPQLAAAIENGDEKLLTSLPEIGRKTAAQIVADLRGRLAALLSGAAIDARFVESDALSAPQRVALEILVQWGDRRADAQRWLVAAATEDPSLKEPDALVRAAYRQKAAGV